MSKAIELLPGQVFGRLTIIFIAPNINGRRAYYCNCTCGNQLIVRSRNLRTGNTKSCGCYAREVFVKTGSKTGGKNRIIVRDDAFDEITEESAYWIGFILGDGHITKNKNSVSISLKRDDEEHLLTFAKWIQFPGKLRYTKREGRRKSIGGKEWYYGVHIRFSSKRIVEILSKYKITPNKTLTAQAHEDLINNRHFWRGVIDADGSIGWKKILKRLSPRLNLVGSPILIEQFKNIAHVLTQSKASQRKKGIIDDIGYSAYSAVKLIKWLCQLFPD